MKFKDLLQHNISYPTFLKSPLFQGLLAFLLPAFSLYLFWESYLGSQSLNFVYAFGDPDYGYLFNSLLMLDGHSPWHIDHPGTPVQMVGALLMRLRYLLAGTETSLAADFFAHSLAYHRDLVLAGFGVFALSQWFCGWRLQRAGAGAVAALLAQASPLFFWATVQYLKHTSPETWIAAVSLLLIPALWSGHAVAAGVLVGVILTLKIYSLPLVLVFFLLPRPRDWLLASASCAGMALAICSVWFEHLPRWLNWMTLLSTRSGNYGTGPEGLPGAATLAQNLAFLATPELWGLFWLAAVLLPLTAFYTVRMKGKGPRLGFEVLAGLVILLFAIRHNPVPRYLIPLTAPLGLLLARVSVLPLALRVLALPAAVLALGLGLGENVVELRAGRVEIVRQNEAIEAELAKFPDCAYLFPNAVPLEPFALFSGHLATSGLYGEELRRLYPRYFFPAVDSVYRTYTHGEWNREMLDQALAAYPCRVYVYDDLIQTHLPSPSAQPVVPPPSKPPYKATPSFSIIHYVKTPRR